ncbi:MAG: type II secretion system protein [Candidatus Omnitrophota bacterium]
MTQINKKGFTLIEIIIALTILGIGLVSAMAYLPVALDAARKASDINKAALIAQSRISEVKAASYTNFANADTQDTGGLFVADADYSGFSYMIDVADVAGKQLKTVTVTVQWTFRGKNNSDVFTTEIVKYNPT